MKKIFLFISLLFSLASFSQDLQWKDYFDRKKGEFYADSLYASTIYNAGTVHRMLIVDTTAGIGKWKVYHQAIPAASGDNIYTADGTLDNWRILTGADKSLTMTFNTIDSSGLIVSSTSTAAANNMQKGINVLLSGTNGTSAQTTYGIYSANSHAGTTSINYSGYFISTNGTSQNIGAYGNGGTYGLQGVSTAGSGVRGDATTGTGVSGVATGAAGYGGNFESAGSGGVGVYAQANVTNGKGVWGSSTVGVGAQFNVNPSSTNTMIPIASFYRSTSGSTANGLGGYIDFYGTTTVNDKVMGLVGYQYKSVTDASRTTQYVSTAISNGTVDTLSTMGGYVTLTESSATIFTTTTVASSKIQGGTILVTIEANDATDFQARTMRFIWSAVNKAGTTTITISTPEEVVALSSGTLTCTITATDGGSGVVRFNANAVSSLTQTTLRATYQVFKNF